MRAWILRHGADTDGSLFHWEPAPGHLVWASWVDGTGDVGDTCEVALQGVDAAGVDKLLSSRLSLLLAPPADDAVEDLLCYGPYDCDPVEVSGEAAQWRVTGRIGSHFEATVADRTDEAEFYAALEKAITDTLAASEPWKGWASGAGAPAGADAAEYSVANAEFIWGQIRAELVNAVDLAAVRQILAQWGLTAVPAVDSITPTGFRHRVRVEPLHRPDTARFDIAAGTIVRLTSLGAPAGFSTAAAASTINLAEDHLDAHPAVSWGDGVNRVDDFRTRQILAIRRLFGESIMDNIILSAGTLRPPVYLEADNGPALIKVREELERWRLQNSAAMLTAIRRFSTPYSDVAKAFVTPYQLAIVGAHHLPPGDHGRVWQVTQVNHAWSAEAGYAQEVRATLWQGGFTRTSGSDVRAISI